MSDNPWRYFRCVGDNAIRRVRQGECGTIFYRGGGQSLGDYLPWYLEQRKDHTEITESEAVDILGGRPWEPALTPQPQPATPTADQPAQPDGDKFVKPVVNTEFICYGAGGSSGVGGPGFHGARVVADQPPPVPSSAFAVQIGGEHYKNLPIQPIEYCQRNGLGAVESFVVKYVTRWKSKGGVEDLRKAIHLLEMLIEMEAKQ